MKRAAKIVGVAAGVYLLLTVALYFCIRTPEWIEKLMSAVPFPVLMPFPIMPLWNLARGGDLKVGDAAPDFSLELRGENQEQEPQPVTLSSFRGEKPVVLIFGSYT